MCVLVCFTAVCNTRVGYTGKHCRQQCKGMTDCVKLPKQISGMIKNKQIILKKNTSKLHQKSLIAKLVLHLIKTKHAIEMMLTFTKLHTVLYLT